MFLPAVRGYIAPFVPAVRGYIAPFVPAVRGNIAPFVPAARGNIAPFVQKAAKHLDSRCWVQSTSRIHSKEDRFMYDGGFQVQLCVHGSPCVRDPVAVRQLADPVQLPAGVPEQR